MISVMIADDHAIVRQGLKQILSETDDIKVTGEAETGFQAIKIARQQDFDVMLLDISLPDRNGIEILKQIKKDRPSLAVLMLSMHNEHEFAIRALKAGASGYLNKQSAPAQLVVPSVRWRQAISMSVRSWRKNSPISLTPMSINRCTPRYPIGNIRRCVLLPQGKLCRRYQPKCF